MLLNRLLGEVLDEQEGHELHELARQLGTQQDGDPDRLFQRIPELQQPQLVQRLLRAFTILFQLLNVAEQKEIIRINRERQAGTPSPRPESIREAVLRLKKSGLSAARVQELLSQVDICPTLTAHPTEVRRRAVQDKLQTIAKWLVEYHQPAWLPRLELPLSDTGLAEQELLRTLTALWQTDELRPNPPTVDDEVQNVLYFFEHTILNRVTWLHHDLRAALEEAYPGESFNILPFIHYRCWVGGDRDGNPNVTTEVTWRTVLAHKELALNHYLSRVGSLQQELTQSVRIMGASEELLRSIECDGDPKEADELLERDGRHWINSEPQTEPEAESSDKPNGADFPENNKDNTRNAKRENGLVFDDMGRFHAHGQIAAAKVFRVDALPPASSGADFGVRLGLSGFVSIQSCQI